MYLEPSCLSLWRDSLCEEVKQFRSFVEALEAFLSEQSRKSGEAFQASSTGMTDELRFEHAEWASDYFRSVEHDLPRILRYSLFVHAYSTIEFTLEGIANLCNREWKLSLSPSDLKGKGIRRAKDYLKKVAGVELPAKGRLWEDMCVLADIRNLVVHNSGFLPEDGKRETQIEAFLAGWRNYVRLDDVRRFSFEPGFVIRVLDVFQPLLKELLDSLESEEEKRTSIKSNSHAP